MEAIAVVLCFWMHELPDDLRGVFGVGAGERLGVLFVCLGNICRSPLARAIFEHQANAAGVLARFDVDSCGTGGWHAGEDADPRSRLVAERHGVAMVHRARQIAPAADFARFHLLLAMDERNRADVIALGAPRERVFLMRRFEDGLDELGHGQSDQHLAVPDPYYGGNEGFQRVFEMLWLANEGLLRRTSVAT